MLLPRRWAIALFIVAFGSVIWDKVVPESAESRLSRLSRAAVLNCETYAKERLTSTQAGLFPPFDSSQVTVTKFGNFEVTSHVDVTGSGVGPKRLPYSCTLSPEPQEQWTLVRITGIY